MNVALCLSFKRNNLFYIYQLDNMSRKSFYTNIHFIFLSGGILFNFLIACIYSYINVGEILKWSELPGFLKQGWPVLLQTFVILYFVYYTIQYFNRKYVNGQNSLQRFLREILFVMVVGFAVMEFFRWIFITYNLEPEDPVTLNKKLKMIQMINLTLLIVIYAFMTSFRIFIYLQQKQLELLKWQREYTQSQFEAMKNQLNPHFLFNSLSALTSLVYADADLAETFIEKLSKTYRYLLEQKDKEVVPLEQELNFIRSYVFLMEQRFGKKFKVVIDDINAKHYDIPPHSLMVLFEYIINTNAMSANKPLIIELHQFNGALVISYSRQPKETNAAAKDQLMRLKERYTYISEKVVMVEENNERGKISLPLLQLQLH